MSDDINARGFLGNNDGLHRHFDDPDISLEERAPVDVSHGECPLGSIDHGPLTEVKDDEAAIGFVFCISDDIGRFGFVQVTILRAWKSRIDASRSRMAAACSYSIASEQAAISSSSTLVSSGNRPLRKSSARVTDSRYSRGGMSPQHGAEQRAI
ncbi:MAG: hypothetical protein MZV49_09240 [Rhodopseudomonas palustris]|nr:hypothetical protein [Rhodopseudomonas palustris]